MAALGSSEPMPPAISGRGAAFLAVTDALPAAAIAHNPHTAGKLDTCIATVPAKVPSVMPSHMKMPYRPTTRPRRSGGYRCTSQAAPPM